MVYFLDGTDWQKDDEEYCDHRDYGNNEKCVVLCAGARHGDQKQPDELERSHGEKQRSIPQELYRYGLYDGQGIRKE